MATRTLGQKILIGIGIIFLVALVAFLILVGIVTGVFNIQKKLPVDNDKPAVAHPVKVLFAVYPDNRFESNNMFQGRNACTFKDCFNFATIVDTDGKIYRYGFDENNSSHYVFISPNREYVFLPIDSTPRRFYRGALTPYALDERSFRPGLAYVADDGTLVAHTSATAIVPDMAPAMQYITDTKVDTKPFAYKGAFQACDGRLFYFGNKIKDGKVESFTWHEFEVDPKTQTITPLNRFNELRHDEEFLHRQCLEDGKGSMAMVTKLDKEFTLMEWNPDQGIGHEEVYVVADLYDAEQFHITKDYLILMNDEGEFERFDRHTQQLVETDSLNSWDGRLDLFRSITRFDGDRAFVLGNYDRDDGDGPIQWAWMGLEVKPSTGEVVQRVRLPYFDETYPGGLGLFDLKITDGDAFSAWLKTQPAFTE